MNIASALTSAPALRCSGVCEDVRPALRWTADHAVTLRAQPVPQPRVHFAGRACIDHARRAEAFDGGDELSVVAVDLPVVALDGATVAEATIDRRLRGPQGSDGLTALVGIVELPTHQPRQRAATAVRGEHRDIRDVRAAHRRAAGDGELRREVARGTRDLLAVARSEGAKVVDAVERELCVILADRRAEPAAVVRWKGTASTAVIGRIANATSPPPRSRISTRQAVGGCCSRLARCHSETPLADGGSPVYCAIASLNWVAMTAYPASFACRQSGCIASTPTRPCVSATATPC